MGGVRGTHPQQGSTRTTSITVAVPTLVLSPYDHLLVNRRRIGGPGTCRIWASIPAQCLTLVLEITNPHLGLQGKVLRP